MSENWFELGVIVFIIIGIAAAVRAGQANPEGTGTLGKKFTALEGDVRTMQGDVRKIERRVGHIEQSSAKSTDIVRLEKLIEDQGRQLDEQNRHLAKLGEAVAASRAAGEHRGKQLDMIFQQIVEKGMK